MADSSAPPLHLIQRDVLHDVHAQGFDSPQNAGLSRYIYSYWRVLTTVLAPLVVLSVVTIGVLCCKSQSHPGKKRTAIDETPLSKNSEQIGMVILVFKIFKNAVDTTLLEHFR